MTEVDLVLSARWVVPVSPDDPVLPDHSVVVDHGRIVAVLPRTEAEARYRGREALHLPEHVVVPGFVNAHTHSPMSLLRGFADDLALMEWLSEHIWPAEARWVSADFVRDGSRLAIAEMIRGGTTCFSDMYFFPGDTAEVAVEAGIRCVMGLTVIDVPTAWARTPEEYLSRGLDAHRRFADEPLVRSTLAPHAPYTVSDETFERVRDLADTWGLRVHVHVQETAGEVRDHLDAHGVRPLERLARLGLVDDRLIAVHMVHLEPAEIECVAAAGAGVVHCPESNLKLASGVCPVHALQEAGVPVALGTDGAASNNDLDLLGEARTAALVGKWAAGDPRALSARRTLRMATLEGARVLGMAEEIGSIEPGKAADLVAVDLSGPETQPVYDPVAQLIYAAGRDRVTDVWIGGRPVLRAGTSITVDPDRCVAAARAWGDRLCGRSLEGSRRLP